MPNFPILQAEPGARPATWLNLRELGRVFDLTGPQMGKKLKDLGWMGDDKIPSPSCLATPCVKVVKKPVYGPRGDLKPSDFHAYRWHRVHAVRALQALGLRALSEEEVFVRAVADRAATSLKEALRRVEYERKKGNEEGLSWVLSDSEWLVERLKQNIALIPAERHLPFVIAVRDQLLFKKFKLQELNLLLIAAGELPSIRSHELATAWASEGLQAKVASVVRPRM